MTAVNSLQSPTAPGPEPRPYEPSMEEILASIRRIIADDQSLPGRPAPREADPAPAAEPARVEDHAPTEPVVSAPVHVIHAVQTEAEPAQHVADFELTRPLAHGPIAAPQFASPEGTDSAGGSPSRESHEPAGDAAPETAEGAAEMAEPEPYVETLDAPEPMPLDAHEPIESGESERWRASHAEPTAAPEPPATLFSNATDHSVTAAFNTLAATRLADNSDELLGLAREMIRPLLKTWLDDNLPSMVERMVRAEIERVARGGR